MSLHTARLCVTAQPHGASEARQGPPAQRGPGPLRVAGFQLSDTSLASQMEQQLFHVLESSSQSLAARVGIREAGWGGLPSSHHGNSLLALPS